MSALDFVVNKMTRNFSLEMFYICGNYVDLFREVLLLFGYVREIAEIRVH